MGERESRAAPGPGTQRPGGAEAAAERGLDASLAGGRPAGTPDTTPDASPGASPDADWQLLLARAVREVSSATGCARTAAWARDAQGVARVACARLEGADLKAPEEALFRAAATLPGPSDLGAPSPDDAGSAEALRQIAEVHGFSAAAPVGPRGSGADAVLLVGDDREPPGRVRPRTLAVLDRVTGRMAGPAAAALATRRLADLGDGVRRLDRLAALGSLVTEIVHEIRNPLVSVKTFLQLLPERVDDPEFRESFLEVASEELRRVERLLDVVLEHGRPAAPSRLGEGAELAPAFESVSQLVSFRAAERGVALAVDDATGLPAARISDDALRQVVLNLVLNALDVTPAGEEVRIAAAQTDAGLLISVDDRGPGIAPALRARLFEPFYSTKGKRPGGLGLAITRRIVDEAGGHIEIAPHEGGGSSVRVTLQRH